MGRDEIRGIVRDELAAVAKSVQRLEQALLGPEGDPCKGIVVRLDRLEQAEKSRKFWVATAVGSAVAALIQAVFAFFNPQIPRNP